MNEKEDVNILILGETGVGKSTWINGIANYAKHNTLQKAMNDSEFTVLIPSRFSFTTDEGESKDISVGSDLNEVFASGQSATQCPQEHMLETDTTRFHLIDTPGIGDCRGVEKDKENFENILDFLTCYDKLNAVVVLLKPNNSRLTVAFKFCVLELLAHKSLVSNIIFAFTNSRGTFYRPGDSLPVLKKLLEDNEIGINLSPSNYFCFDNEAFRFLACHKNGIQFTSEEVELYSKSWVKSCDTTCKLFDLVKIMQPHETKKTVMNEKEDVNILILGETGVGKSTWINGIANYAKHKTLQKAMNDSEFTVLIPSRFNFTTDEGESKDISVGSDKNEVFASGQSATQFPQEHMLETDTTRFHLIDTPGMGDCRGIEKDKENFENILDFLTCYDKLNAVVVLLKPNNSRLTVAFKFCVLELLAHLHKSLVSNIIFAFTNSRGTFYRPGDSLPVLKKLLEDNEIGINLSQSNYFCFDNEAFRFLACHKNGIQFTSEEVELCSNSWMMSCDTTCKLFNLVKNMQPHETKKTVSLNEARNCIIAIRKPMGQVVQLIEMNLKKAKDVKDLIKVHDADIRAFQADLYFKVMELKIKPLNYPMTVCAAEKCNKYENIGNSRERNIVYQQICHSPCFHSDVSIETTNNPQLRECTAMSDGKCTKCSFNCDFSVHRYITYTTHLVEKEFMSDDAQAKISEKSDMKSKKESFLVEVERKISELESEKEYIYDCASYFGVFLKENAMIAYNDSFGEYLDMLIREEEAKETVIKDDKKIQKMKQDKKTYEKKKMIIMEKIASGCKDKKEAMPLEKIYEMRQKLCSLKHNGKTLKEALDGVISARERKHEAERKSRVVAKTDKFRELLPHRGVSASPSLTEPRTRTTKAYLVLKKAV